MPRTSPVDLISGPRRGSTSGNMLKGKTASLAPKWGTRLSRSSISPSLFPIISSVAIRAMETLQTLETRGDGPGGPGFASRT